MISLLIFVNWSPPPFNGRNSLTDHKKAFDIPQVIAVQQVLKDVLQTYHVLNLDKMDSEENSKFRVIILCPITKHDNLEILVMDD